MMQKNLSILEQNEQDSMVYFKQGDRQFIYENYEQSMKFYDLVIKINPQSSKGYIGKGKVYNIQKKFNEAFDMFEKAQELNPLDDQVYLNRGNTYLNLNDNQKAIEQYDYAIKLDSRDPEVYLIKGDQLIAIGNMEEAFQMYNTANKYKARGSEFLYRGDNYFDKKQYDVAIKFFELYNQQDPIRSYLRQGDTLMAQGKIEEAFCMYTESLQYHPTLNQFFLFREFESYKEDQHDLALKFYQFVIEYYQREKKDMYLHDCYLKKGDTLLAWGKIEEAICMFREMDFILRKDHKYHRNRDFILIKKGDKYYKEQQYDISIQFYEVVIELNLKDYYNGEREYLSEAYLKKGDALMTQGKIEEAFCMFTEAVKYNPKGNDFLKRGDKYFEKKQYDVAIKFFMLYTQIKPLDGYLKQGDTLLAQEKIQEALCMFTEAVQYNPGVYEISNRGDKYFEKKQYDVAIKFFELQTQVYPLSGNMKQGDTLLAQGKIEEAFFFFREAVKYNPLKHNFLYYGNKYFEEKQYDLAIKFFELQTLVDPLSGNLNQGDTLLAQGKIEEAFVMFKEALKYNPKKDEFSNRGNKYFEDKQYDLAIKLFELQTKVYPLDGYLKQGDILLAKGQIEEAFCMFTEALKYNPPKDQIFQPKYPMDQQYDVAIQLYQLLATLDPLEFYLKKGDYLLEQGKIEEAFFMFSEALKYNPEYTLLSRGEKYYQEKQYDVAVQFLQLALKVNPLEHYLQIGGSLMMMGKTEEAFPLLKEGLQQNPDDLSTFTDTVYKEKYEEKAIIFNSFLIYYQPDNIQHYLKQGDMLYKLGRTAEAIQILQKIPPEANLKYMLYLNRQFQEADDMICLDSNLKSDWAYHQVLILQEQGKYKIPKQEIQYVGSDLVVLK